ncbi:ABC transporter permease [Paenibacillus sp. 32O-W]|uniref:ABC transporter permease n=1 Tax=Paenibacillus sp. 32O-W TaxID=1695218 RepID=UPI000722B5B7|nr:ABC transporter permease [Paenibacillus sp. 32O-W]
MIRPQTWGRDIRRRMNGWTISSLIVAAAILLPVFFILVSLAQGPGENWSHIKQYVLKDAVMQSAWLALLTGLFTTGLGVGLAWLTAAYDFPLSRLFRWAFALPLAIPPYIAAYTYSAMLGYTGVVQTTLRNTFGLQLSQGWFNIMSVQGAVFIFTMFLFPYVYLIARAFLESQTGAYVENARLLGRGPWSVFWLVVLPISRPAIAGGVILVCFEVLGDYGVVSYFGISTISTAIFKTWFGMYDIASASRLAAWLMIGVLGLFLLERQLRRQRRYSATTGKSRPLVRRRLRGAGGAAACMFGAVVMLVSFVIPVAQLVVWATWTADEVWHEGFYRIIGDTVAVAIVPTALTMVAAAIVAVSVRQFGGIFGYMLAKAVTAGYSIPGAIIAIGVLAVFIKLDGWLAPVYAALRLGTGEAPLVLSLSIVMLVAAYVVRFMATGYNALEAGFEKIGPQYAEASRLLGRGRTQTFLRVELPLLKGALLSGTVLTFVEIVKELPLALLLRPFNFQTLATKTYQYASDERIHEASVPALCIVVVSLASVYLLNRIERGMEV